MNSRIYFILIACLLSWFMCPSASFAVAPSLSATTVYWTSPGKISSVTTTTAQLGATIDSDGGEAISERGIVWSISDATPTIGEPGVTKTVEGGTAAGIFAAGVSGLTKASMVYFSGYATNLSGTSYSPVATFYTEPDTAAAPAVVLPTGTNYFDLTVNYTKPANADGVLVVVRQSYTPANPPYDGTTYIANARIGTGDPTVPGCIIYCEYVVADAAADGSVTVTGLKEGFEHFFTVYAYKGTGTGVSGVNYVQTINAAGPVATNAVPLAGTSHNELWVALNSPRDGTGGGSMTSTDCANCHGSHHTSQLLSTGLAMANNCFTCHNDAGDVSMHAAGTVDCGTCHSLHSFRTEELYSNSPGHTANQGFNLSFVRKNMTKYFNTANTFPTDALEPTVFQTRPGDYAYSTGPFNAVCQTCHTLNSHHTQTATDGHQIGNNCIACHPHKSSDANSAFTPAAHPTDFGKDAECTICHTGILVMENIHGDGTTATCTICHDGAPSRDNEKLGDAANGIDGDARLADGTAAANTWAGVTCLTCHPSATYPMPAIHHDHAEATGGNCIFCHQPDVGQTEVDGSLSPRSSLAMPANLACNWCHLWWPNNKNYYTANPDNGYNSLNGTIKIYSLKWDPNSATTTPTAKDFAFTQVLTSHSISTNTITPISDYAACFSCHGASAATKAGGKQVRPFHGFGPAVTGFEPLTGDSGSVNVLIEWYAGPTSTGQSQAVSNTPWHPGFAAFNHVAAEVRPVTGTKKFSIDTRKAHDADWSKPWTAANAITAVKSGEFAIPWDNYGPTHGGPTGTSDIFNTGGQTGSFTKSTIVPLVPLNLPTSITP